MKYKLLKDLPLAKAGTEVELKDDGIHYAIMADEMIDFVTLGYILSKDISEWLEPIVENKTIYDLKTGDTFYCIRSDGITKEELVGYFSENASLNSFVTEREAKRNKLLRELATREKWLPEQGEIYYSYHLSVCDNWNWQGDNTDVIKLNSGFVFRDEIEYNKWITPEAKDLLFKI